MNNQKKRILIVDDDPKVTRQLRFNLEHTGDLLVHDL
jgi:DNA-binding response OmpR family regulator